MTNLKVLVACEYSGRVRDAFARLGHYAVSCDLLDSDTPGMHHKGDVLDIIDAGWDILIAHPPCQYLCSSGLHWNQRGVLVDGRPRAELTEEALRFVERLMVAPVEHIGIENSRGCIGTRIDATRHGFRTSKATQTIQPYQFGHDASKTTDLWLKNLPDLTPTEYIEGRVVDHNRRGQPIYRWANQTDSGQNRLGPSEDRWKIRSETYQGIADAMAGQWSSFVQEYKCHSQPQLEASCS